MADTCVNNYQVEAKEFSEVEFVRLLIEGIRQTLQGVRVLLEEGMKLCEEPDGPYLYAEALEADLEMIRSMEKTTDAFLTALCKCRAGSMETTFCQKR